MRSENKEILWDCKKIRFFQNPDTIYAEIFIIFLNIFLKRKRISEFKEELKLTMKKFFTNILFWKNICQKLLFFYNICSNKDLSFQFYSRNFRIFFLVTANQLITVFTFSYKSFGFCIMLYLVKVSFLS